MLELKNIKHNTYYRCAYLYIVNAVNKLLLTSYLQRDLAKNNNNNNITTLICLAISVHAKVLHDPLEVWIDMKIHRLHVTSQCFVAAIFVSESQLRDLSLKQLPEEV